MNYVIPKKAGQMHIKVGRTYRGKAPGYSKGFVNDRTVILVDRVKQRVQYDGPGVSLGQPRPIVALEHFCEWAQYDVTDQLPAGEYQQWGEYLARLETRRKELKACRTKRTKQPAKLTVEKTSPFVKHTGIV